MNLKFLIDNMKDFVYYYKNDNINKGIVQVPLEDIIEYISSYYLASPINEKFISFQDAKKMQEKDLFIRANIPFQFNRMNINNYILNDNNIEFDHHNKNFYLRYYKIWPEIFVWNIGETINNEIRFFPVNPAIDFFLDTFNNHNVTCAYKVEGNNIFAQTLKDYYSDEIIEQHQIFEGVDFDIINKVIQIKANL